MKKFTNNKLIHKLIIIFVCIFLLDFGIATPRVQAAGGILFAPIKLLLTSIADITVSTVQTLITGQWLSAVQDDSGKLTNEDEIGSNTFWKRKIDFPTIQVSPELIFSNKIELLNIDFIGGNEPAEDDEENENTDSKYIIEDDKHATSDLRVIIASWYVTLRTIAIVGSLSVLLYIGIRIMISSTAGNKSKYKQMLVDWVIAFCILIFMHYIMAATVNIVNRIDELLATATHVTDGISLQVDHGGVVYNPVAEFDDTEDKIAAIEGTWDVESLKSSIKNKIIVEVPDGSEYYPIPEDNKTLLYNTIDLQLLYEDGPFIDDGTETYQYKFTDKAINEFPGMYENEIGTLTLRLDVKTVEGEKWVTGGSMTVEGNKDRFPNVSEVSNEIFANVSESVENQDIETIQAEVGPSEIYPDDLNKITFTNGKTALISKYSAPEGDGSKILYFINYARLYVNAYDTATAFGYLILYIILIVYLVMFTIRYMKRVIYIAFLTLIAPLVALTYPLDKIRDGQAQAFNMWFREYIFNVMIQPFHLLIYTILVGSAMTFASSYMIYAIIAIAFLIPAEKLLRSFFGFDKAGTLSAAGSFAGGALFSSVLNKINKSSGSGGGSGSYDAGSNGNTTNVRTVSNAGDFDAKKIVFGTMGYNTDTPTLEEGPNENLNTNLDIKSLKSELKGDLSPEEQAEKEALNNYFHNPASWEEAYTNPAEYQLKLDRMKELESKQRFTAQKVENNVGNNVENNVRNNAVTNKTKQFRLETASSSTGSEMSSLTLPVFERGDKWHIARGHRKVNGKWIDDRWQVDPDTGEYIKDSNGKNVPNKHRDTQTLRTRMSNAVGAAAYMPYRKIADKVNTLPKSAGRLVRKVAVGGVVGGALGTAGFAIGAASGDPSKAFSLASAGAVAGYYGANRVGDKVAKSVGEDVKSARAGFWGEDAEKIEQAKYDDKFSKDPKNVETLTKALGTRDKAKEAIKKGHVQAFLNKGITDTAKIGKALNLMYQNKLDAKNEADGLEKAVALTVLDKGVNHTIYDKTSTHRATFIEREVEELVESGMKKETATEKVEKILSNLEYLNS